MYVPTPHICNHDSEVDTGIDNFIFVVGDDEKRNRMVNIRYRDDTSTQARDVPVPLIEAVEKLKKLKSERGMYNPFPPSKEEEKESKAKA
jgi:threonyl-tRNA synthetase